MEGALYVSAIYDRINVGDGRVRLGLTSVEFADELRRQLDSGGRVLAFAQAYRRRGLVRFSAVWSPPTSERWAAGHRLSKYALLNKLADFADADVPLTCVTAYVVDHAGDDVDGDDAGTIMFAALWR